MTGLQETREAERQRLVLQQMPGFVAVLSGPEHRFDYVNDAYVAMVGAREFLGRPVRDVFPDVDGQGFYELLDQVYASGEAVSLKAMPIRFVRDAGAERFVDFIYQPVKDEAGAVTGIFVGGYDATAAVRDQARLKALAELGDVLRRGDDPENLPYLAAEILGRSLGVSRVGYGAIDEATETLHVTRDWTADGVGSLAGVSPLREFGDFMDSLRADELIAIDDVREDGRTVKGAKALEARSTRSFVNVPVVERDVLVAVLYVNDAHARHWRPDELALIGDVARQTRAAIERYRTEAALRESESRYRTLFEAVDVGFCVIEMKFDASGSPIDYRLVEINPAFERQTGLYGAGGKWVSEAAPGLERHWFELYGAVARTGKAVRFENEAVPLGRWYDVHAFPTGAPQDNRVAVLFSDITARKLADDQLHALNITLEERVAERAAERDRLWALSQDMLARADYSGMMSAVSPAWQQVLGWSEEELLSREYSSFMHPDDMGPTLEALARMGETGKPARFENRISTSDGGWKSIEWTVTPEADGANFIAVGRDLSAAKAREAELSAAQSALRQSQKMDAMGQLTGGVAHDFNNLLTPILGSLDMLQRGQLGGPREQRLIDGALQSAERARTLVQRLLAFARRQPLQPTAVDLGGLVHGMAELITSTSGPQVRVVTQVSADLPAAKADQNQLEMAILNLAVNARDAMPGGGTLSVSAEQADPAMERPSGLAPGRYLRLAVADTGAGMDEATLRRATEPFFSTKGVGKGTGLGLSMVHGLASQLGGSMTIASRPGLGTRVELWLPVSDEAAEVVERDTGSDGMTPRAGVALLVDDEDIVRSTTADMLADLGYRVIEASSASEALALVENGLQFDLLLTDHLMPGMTGTELARKVQERWPTRPVLVMSGFAETEGVAPDLPRLTKPYRQAELAQALSGILTSN